MNTNIKGKLKLLSVICGALFLAGCGESLEERVAKGEPDALFEYATTGDISTSSIYKPKKMDYLVRATLGGHEQAAEELAKEIQAENANETRFYMTCDDDDELTLVKHILKIRTKLNLSDGEINTYLARRCWGDSMLVTAKKLLKEKEYITAYGIYEHYKEMGNERASKTFMQEAPYFMAELIWSGIMSMHSKDEAMQYYLDAAKAGNEKAKEKFIGFAKTDLEIRLSHFYFGNSTKSIYTDFIDEAIALGANFTPQIKTKISTTSEKMINGLRANEFPYHTWTTGYNNWSIEMEKRGVDMSQMDKDFLDAVEESTRTKLTEKPLITSGFMAVKHKNKQYLDKMFADVNTLFADANLKNNRVYRELKPYLKFGHPLAIQSIINMGLANQDASRYAYYKQGALTGNKEAIQEFEAFKSSVAEFVRDEGEQRYSEFVDDGTLLDISDFN